MGDRVTVSITKQMYGWSKYGGPRYGILKESKDWFCQACGKKQVKEMAQYMLPIDGFHRDFVRICGICKHTQHKRRLDYRQLCYRIRIKEQYGK